MSSRILFLVGLFIVCMATLMLQIIQTRLLSVVSMYYLAFLSISMAMLGMTAGALLTYFRLGHITPSNVTGYLSRLSTVYALVTVTCLLVQLASPLPPVRIATLILVWGKMLFLLAAPFTVAGVIVSLALTRSPYPIGLTYAVDLIGAAFGCLLVLPLLHLVDAASGTMFVAALVALAGIAFREADQGKEIEGTFPNWRILSRPRLIMAVLLALGAVNSVTRYGFQPISAKFGIISVGTYFEYEKWNSFSRVLTGKSEFTPVDLWGPSPTLPAGLKAEQRRLNIDGFAGTTMPRFSGDRGTVDFLKYDITNLVYAFRPPGKVAIVGVGSGRDILSAHVFGAIDITGVELNPIFVDLLTDPAKLRNYAGIADLSGVRIFVDDGRSWFARTKEKFDVIEMSMIDTFAATGAGAFSLSENGLYTIEGWRIFLSALTPSGVFSVSRWHAPSAPVEVGRTASLAVGALLSLGVKQPRDHIFIASVGRLATVIVSLEPLSPANIAALRDTSARMQYKILASPNEPSSEPVFRDLLAATSEVDLNRRAEQYWLDLSPPTDSRPFFFNQLRLSNVFNLGEAVSAYRTMGSFVRDVSVVVVGNFVAVATLFLLIALSSLAVAFTILLPARASVREVNRNLAWFGSAYFLLIGLGFMFVELALIQRLSLIMGHPIYALSVVLFGIILSTGIGSLLSERFVEVRFSTVLIWLALLVIYLLTLPSWLPSLASSVEASGLVTRSLSSVAIIFPAGLLMGFGFPFGMRLVTKQDPRPTPWFWGINGAAGVLAAGLAVACSMTLSIDATMRAGAICYLLLGPTILFLLRGERGISGVVRSEASHGEPSHENVGSTL